MHLSNNKNIESYKKFAKLSLFAFMLNWPNFVLTLADAIYAKTIVVWIDTLVTLSETLHSLIVWLVALKLCRDNRDKYNYGMGRFEVFISFLCELLISIGMFCMMGGAVWNIITPTVPDSSLGYFVLMKVSCTAWDIFLFVKQVKICRANPSKLNRTEKKAYLVSLINDAVMGVIAVICYFCRTYNFVQYFSPIASIVLAIYFLVGYVKGMKVSIGEIVDFSLPVKKQDEIFDIVLEKRKIIKKITSVNCHKLNGKSLIEISLVLEDGVTYSEMNSYLEVVREKIEKIEPDSKVTLVIGNEENEGEEVASANS